MGQRSYATHSLDELEATADEKSGSMALLDAKWRKVYKAASPRGLVTKTEMRVA